MLEDCVFSAFAGLMLRFQEQPFRCLSPQLGPTRNLFRVVADGVYNKTSFFRIPCFTLNDTE